LLRNSALVKFIIIITGGVKKMFGAYLTYFFPCGRVVKLFANGVNITNSTSPLALTKNITLTVLDCCAPSPIRLAANCIGAVALIGASIAYPNTLTISSAVHLVSEIYNNCQ
jgi:hypothetical protein